MLVLPFFCPNKGLFASASLERNAVPVPVDEEDGKRGAGNQEERKPVMVKVVSEGLQGSKLLST